jgi:hypothetical protein
MLGFSNTTSPVQYSLMCWYTTFSLKGNRAGER